MQAIPVILSDEYYDLFLIMEEDIVLQMKAYDPPEISTLQLPVEFLSRKVNNIVLMYATSEDLERVSAACDAGNLQGALRILSRGYGWRPDSGNAEHAEGSSDEME